MVGHGRCTHLRYVKERLLPLRHRQRMRRDIAAAFEDAESVLEDMLVGRAGTQICIDGAMAR